MAKSRWLLSFLVLVPFLLSASSASSTAIIGISYFSNVEYSPNGYGMFTGFHPSTGSGGDFFFSAPTTGSFSQEYSGGFYIEGGGMSTWYNGSPPDPYTIEFHLTGHLDFSFSFPPFEYESDMPFSRLSLTAKILIDGVEATFFSETWNRAALLNAGSPEWTMTNWGWTFYSHSDFDLGTIIQPVEVWAGFDDIIWWSYSCYLSNSWPLSFTISGDVVPLPPTLLLFGSGLLGLAGLRRLKKS
jgi:hypothetical protein